MSENNGIQEKIDFLRNRIAVLEYTIAQLKSTQLSDVAKYRADILRSLKDSSGNGAQGYISLMEACQLDCSSQLEAYRKEFEATRAEDARLHDAQMETCRKEFEATRAEDARLHDAQMEAYRKEFEATRAEDARLHDAQMETCRKEFEATRAEDARLHDAQMEAYRKEFEATRAEDARLHDAQMETCRKEFEATRAEDARLHDAQMEAYRKEFEATRAEDARLHDAQIEAYRKECERICAAYEQELKRQQAAWRQECERLHAEMALLQNSISWRITKPLRSLASGIKSFIKKLLPRRSLINSRRHPLIAMLYVFQAHRIFKFLLPHQYFAFKARFIEKEFTPTAAAAATAVPNTPSDEFTELIATKISLTSVYNPLVTVIVPNYNHAPFLAERLESIYNQSYQNFEVLLMDDVSSDDSVKILTEYADRYPEKTKLLLNNVNSGSPFSQWRKGMANASGELVWIAESDDYCDLDFLEKLIPKFKIPSVMLAFARSVFVKNGEQVWSIEEYLQDPVFASGNFVMAADKCVKKYFSIHNIIPNVSSCVFRKPIDIKLMDDPEWNRMKVCGDWVFYLHLIRGGAVAYTADTTNYYRQHDSNISVNQHSRDLYYEEHQEVRKHLAENYSIPEEEQQRFRTAMKEFWKLNRDDYSDEAFDKIFDEREIRECAAAKKPAIAMLCFAFSTGGGEKVPIILANAMKRMGHSVTFIDCGGEPEQPGVRKFLNSDIPVVELDWNWNNFYRIISEFGIDCMHSHHASVDFAATQNHPSRVAHIVTTHGMYETVPEKYLKQNLDVLIKSVDLWLYIADKNLDVIKKYCAIDKNYFRKTFNAVIPPAQVISRQEIRNRLRIGDKDFMIVVASRGIPEKGWQEALDAVTMARREATQNINIVFVGNGPEYERMKGLHSDFTRFVGFSQDVFSYFSAADLVVLPSRFKGESFPLVILEAFAVNTPVLATDIGEFKNMLTTPNGLAGDIIPIRDWQLDITLLKDSILHFVNDQTFYREKKLCVQAAKERFSIERLIHEHEKFYSLAIQNATAKTQQS